MSDTEKDAEEMDRIEACVLRGGASPFLARSTPAKNTVRELNKIHLRQWKLIQELERQGRVKIGPASEFGWHRIDPPDGEGDR